MNIPRNIVVKSLSVGSCSIACFLILIAAIGVGVAQQPSATINSQTILEHSKVAMGCSSINPTTSIAVFGTLQVTAVSTPMPVSIFSQGNSRWRSELDTPKEHKVTIVNDGNGQVQHADGSVQKLAENNTYHQRPMHIPCLTTMSLPIGLLETSYLRTDVAGNELLDVLEISPSGHPQIKAELVRVKTTVWISRTSGYLVRLQYVNTTEQDSNDTQVVQIDYTDYRIISGVAIPFHQITTAGQLTLDLVITTAQLNAPAADFQLR